MSFLSLLFVYLIGGISFLPLLLGLVLCYAHFTFPHVLEEPVSDLIREGDDERVFKEKTLKIEDEKTLRKHSPSPDVAAGYFAVTREFVPGGVNGRPPERVSPGGTRTPVNDSPSVVQSMYRSLFDRRASTAVTDPNGGEKKVRRARNEFYVVLRWVFLGLLGLRMTLTFCADMATSCYTMTQTRPKFAMLSP